MNQIPLTVNGRRLTKVSSRARILPISYESRLNLTATHLRCEQGACGACTLLMDGHPARSCITYAVMCDGAAITTIEGLDDVPSWRAAARLLGGARAAVRLLHARNAGDGARYRRACPEADRAHPLRTERQSVPLHRLCRYRARHQSRLEGTARGRGLPAGFAGSRWARLAHVPAASAARSNLEPKMRSAAAADSPKPGADGALGLAGRKPNIEISAIIHVARPVDEVWCFSPTSDR